MATIDDDINNVQCYCDTDIRGLTVTLWCKGHLIIVKIMMIMDLKERLATSESPAPPDVQRD